MSMHSMYSTCYYLHPVSNFAKLHALTPVARSYVLLVSTILSQCVSCMTPSSHNFPAVPFQSHCPKVPARHFQDMPGAGHLWKDVAHAHLPTLMEWTQDRSEGVQCMQQWNYVDVEKLFTSLVCAILSALVKQTLHRHQVKWPSHSNNSLQDSLMSWWFVFCRSLDLNYPHFPTEQDFIHNVLSSGDIQSHSQGGNFYLLGHFAQEWPRLQAGGLLLSDLVEFYQWLHTALGEPAQRLCQLLDGYYNSTWSNCAKCVYFPF